VSQELTLLALELEAVNGSGIVASRGGDAVAVALRRVEHISKRIRLLSHRLHPAKLRLLGLVPALEALRRELPPSEVSTTFEHAGVPSSLPDEHTVCLFRIAQEALQNAFKHSGARRVSIDLTGHAKSVVLTIADDGVGFDVSAAWQKGLGLISMSERLEAIGGTLEIRSVPGEGTRVKAEVPVG
jgi:signal transduction histidine kinase